MKISKKQIKRIVLEEKLKLLREANRDGTISDNEEEETLGLIMYVSTQMDDLLMHIRKESDRIGGGFRGPGIRRQAIRALQDEINRFK